MRRIIELSLVAIYLSAIAPSPAFAAPKKATSVSPDAAIKRLKKQAKDSESAGDAAFAKGNLEQGKLKYLAAVDLYKLADKTERQQESGYSTRISYEISKSRSLMCRAARKFIEAKRYAEAQKLAEQSFELGSHYSTPIGPAPNPDEFQMLAESAEGQHKYDIALRNYGALAFLYSTMYGRDEEGQITAMRKQAEMLTLLQKPKEATLKKKEADELWNALHSSVEDLKAACEKGDFVTAKRLVEACANADGDGKCSSRGWGCGLQPLHHAVLSKNKDLVAYLLDHGAKVNNQVSFVDPQNTDGLKEPVGIEPSPLHLAVYNGDVQMARYLLRRGADVKARTTDVQLGPPLNTIGPRGECATPLHFAARGGNVEMVKCLLDAHADARALDINNKTPVDWACNLRTTALLTRPAFNFDFLLPHKM